MTLFCDKLLLNCFLNKIKSFSNLPVATKNRKNSIIRKNSMSMTHDFDIFPPNSITDISKNVTKDEYNIEDYLFFKHRINVMSSIDEVIEDDPTEQ